MTAVFEKGERLRHIGHLDILRAMQRALRRCDMPVSYSNGFNPHMHLTFASALSVGYAGRKELMEVVLTEDISPEAFMTRMNEALPPDLQLSAARAVPEKHPALMAAVQAAAYELRPLSGAEALMAAVPAFLQQESVMALRKTKTGEKEIDIRPLVLSLKADEGVITASMVLTEKAACKPDMLLKALCGIAGVDVPRCMVVRTGLFAQDEGGALVPLEQL